jgi:hypothetical protein
MLLTGGSAVCICTFSVGGRFGVVGGSVVSVTVGRRFVGCMYVGLYFSVGGLRTLAGSVLVGGLYFFGGRFVFFLVGGRRFVFFRSAFFFPVSAGGSAVSAMYVCM